jgi:hypothetical protein
MEEPVKGTVVSCMEDLVTRKFGSAKWKESLQKAGIAPTRLFSSMEDVPDADVLAIMKGIAEATCLSMPQVTEAFGDHWSTQYAPSVYKTYFAAVKSTREFLLNLDQIHMAMTRSIKSAQPPRFRYEWQGDNHLVMHYDSKRGLVALMPGLIHGLGKYYNDRPAVNVVGNAVHVKFA